MSRFPTAIAILNGQCDRCHSGLDIAHPQGRPTESYVICAAHGPDHLAEPIDFFVALEYDQITNYIEDEFDKWREEHE